jgi:hypothetical protein
MSMKQEKSVSIRFPPDILEQLREVANQENRSLNAEVVWIVRQYLAMKGEVHASQGIQISPVHESNDR